MFNHVCDFMVVLRFAFEELTIFFCVGWKTKGLPAAPQTECSSFIAAVGCLLRI
jgi:hypothetical protein